MEKSLTAFLVITIVIISLTFTSTSYALELKDFTNIFKRDQSQGQTEKELLEQTKINQKEFHTPIVNGEKIEAIPYISIPFNENDFIGRSIKISEGWLYSFDEFQIHDMKVHAGVDFSAPYGTGIYAPVDGFAISSYHNLWAEDKNEKVITYQGKEIKYGLGLYVQIYVPQTNRFIQLAHLSEIDEAIPFSEPEFDEKEKMWEPKLPPQSDWAKITKGQILGKVGTSGLNWGYEDFEGKPQRMVTNDPSINKSWDEPHLHFEEFSQVEKPNAKEKLGQKVAPRDIFGIYSFSRDYPSLDQSLDQDLKPLILTAEDGKPLFAK